MVDPVPYATGLVTSSVLALGTAAWVQARGQGEAARLFTYTMVVAAAWPLTFALQESVWVTGDLLFVVTLFEKLSIWSVSVLWLTFVLVYTGRKSWLSKPVFGFLVGELVLASVLAGTNPYHELMWGSLVEGTSALGYGVHILFVYSYLFVGLIVLYRQFLTSRHSARKQTLALILGMAIPLGGNLANNIGVLPSGPKYAALGVGVFAAFVGWGAFSQQLFTTAPLARDTVLELIDEGILVVDVEGRIVDFNARAESAFPTLADGIGRRIDEVVPALIDDGTSAPGERYVDRVTVTDPEDGRTDYEVTVSALSDAGRERGYVLILGDVTDVEQYQTQVKQQNQRLEHVAKTISHDLRNPINVAEGFVQIARENDDLSKLDRVERALDRINEITDEVLTLARQEQAIGDREPVQLRRVAGEAWRMSDTADATLEIDDDGTVHADRERLQTAFENLFRNAVDHGSDDVTVRVGRDGTGFYVEDDGPGIPPDERETVFEYEYTTAEDGTGLGLFTVRTVAEAHGWRVRATDGTDGGARFEFSGVSFVADTGEERSVKPTVPG